MSLKDSAFPASAAFDVIADSIKGNEAEKKAAIKQGNAIFAFTLKNKEGKTESWYIDLKKTGTVGKGLAPAGAKPTVTLILTNEDFESLLTGKGNAQNMFMSGKLKVKGDVMKATKLEPVLKRARDSGAKL